MQKTQIHIQNVIECLQNASSLPSYVDKEQFSIIDELRRVDFDITHRLLPLLFQYRSGNFVYTLNIMHSLAKKFLADSVDGL